MITPGNVADKLIDALEVLQLQDEPNDTAVRQFDALYDFLHNPEIPATAREGLAKAVAALVGSGRDPEEVSLRKLFADAVLLTDRYTHRNITPDVFHETLALVKRKGWLKPYQLLAFWLFREDDDNAVTLEDVRMWFSQDPNKRKAPDNATMQQVLRAVAEGVRPRS